MIKLIQIPKVVLQDKTLYRKVVGGEANRLAIQAPDRLLYALTKSELEDVFNAGREITMEDLSGRKVYDDFDHYWQQKLMEIEK